MIFLIIAVVIGALLWEAWFLMILVGVIHAEWLPMVPTIGYSTALLISLLLTFMSAPAWLLSKS